MFEVEENNDQLNELRKEFPKDQVKQRKGQGNMLLDYISIETTINRILDVAPTATFVCDSATVNTEPPTLNKKTGEPNPTMYRAFVIGHLTVENKTWAGVGADVDKDPDKALKTALAEAIKKAGHGYGIGLYLWDEEKRDEIHEYRANVEGDIGTLKRTLLKLAVRDGLSPTSSGPEIAKHFKIKATELNDPQVLQDVLRKRGEL